jgi:hypothetical protein
MFWMIWLPPKRGQEVELYQIRQTANNSAG